MVFWMFVNSEMDMKILRLCVALVFLTSIGALGRPVSSESLKTAETMEEILWANCRLEMIRSKEEYEDPDFNVYKTFGTNIPANGVLEEENVEKLMSVLYRQISPEFFFCIREKVLISPISGDDSSSSERYLKLLESLASKVPTAMRRYLAGVSDISSPSPSPSQELAQSPGPASSPSAIGLAPRSENSVSALGLAPRSSSATSPSAAEVTVNIESNNNRTIVTSVVVTAVVTFIFALLLFVCCRRWYRRRSGSDYKDDRPLLSISMSDYSGSPKSDVFNSTPSQAMGYQSYGKYSSEGNTEPAFVNTSSNRVDKFSIQPSNVKSNGSVMPLKPPPGRLPPSGFSPLKPSPGIAKPLPHEPPASLRPTPVRAPPPAPAPPPPPPPKKVSAPPPPPIPVRAPLPPPVLGHHLH